MKFYPERLRLARDLRGATLADVGEWIAASPSFISHLENERRQPTVEVLAALGDALGFEPRFFLRPLQEKFTEPECSFRRRSTTPQAVKKEILARGSLFAELLSYLRIELALPPVNIPIVATSGVAGAEAAAEKVRLQWGLGVDAPLSRVGRAIERAGVAILEVDVGCEKIDAFSRWGDTSVIVVNASKASPSRRLFDLAHEAGHLVMHRGQELGKPEQEEEANRFASAFLMPAPGFRRDFVSMPRISWPHLFALKKRWRASVAAIVRRAHDLRLIDAALYRRLNQYIRAKGWHRGEPDEPEMERPELLGLAFRSAQRDLGRNMADIAEALDWKLSTLEDVTGMSATSIHGRSAAGVLNLSDYRQS